MPLVVSGLSDGSAAVEACSSAPLQPLAMESIAFNVTLRVMSDPLMQLTLCLLINFRVSLLRWQAISWLVLKLLYHLLMLVKCGSGNLQQLEVSFFPSNEQGNKNRAMLPRQCYRCLLCSLQVEAGLEKMGNG